MIDKLIIYQKLYDVILYGVALHTWHDVVPLLAAHALMLGGGAPLIAGGYVTRWLVRRWPGVRPE